MLSLEWVHHGYGIGQRQGPRGHREFFISSCQVNVHFVDYDYALVAGQAPQIRSRTYRIEDSPAPPSPGAIATSLDRLTYEPGQIVFRPGDPTGEYYVGLDGEVEIRGGGRGADQAVLPLGPGQFVADQVTLRGQEGALTCHAVTARSCFAVDPTSLRDLPEAGPA